MVKTHAQPLEPVNKTNLTVNKTNLRVVKKRADYLMGEDADLTSSIATATNVNSNLIK